MPSPNNFFSSVTLVEMLTHPIFLRCIFACAISFVMVILAGPTVIRKLTSLKLGQPIRNVEEVHRLAELHGAKAGTPTMGGVMIVCATIINTLIFAEWNIFVLVCLLVMGMLALVGFADDYTKIKQKSSDGISARIKLLGQGIAGLTGICILYFSSDSKLLYSVPEFVSTVFVPFYGPVNIAWLCIPFCMLTVVATSNAVNLTDGLDGLASGCTATNGFAFAFIAFLAGNMQFAHDLNIPFNPLVGEIAVFLMALTGASLGFLWYNCYPAKVFMGDTGSLAIGGALGMAAVCLAQELTLIIIGGVFVLEGASVVLQVLGFQTTGRRIFRMSPIHHHFELGGWKETQVITRFWMLSLFCALFGLLMVFSTK